MSSLAFPATSEPSYYRSILFPPSRLSTFCMLDRFIRPSVEEIKLVSLSLDPAVAVVDVLWSSDVYTRLFKSTLTLSRLRDAVIGGRLLKPSDDPIGVVGRSMIWRVCRTPSSGASFTHPIARKALAVRKPPFETTRTRGTCAVPQVLARLEEGLCRCTPGQHASARRELPRGSHHPRCGIASEVQPDPR